MQENNQLPKIASWLLSKFVKDDLHEEFLGDLQEIYEDRISTKGKLNAKLMYWVDAMHLVIGFTSLNLFKNYNNAIMYKHYLKIASRNLMKYKLYSFINIASLSVGIGICLLIFQYVYFELSYDNFHNQHQNVYRLIIEETNSESDKITPNSSYALGVTATEEIPEIKQYLRKNRFNRGAVVKNPLNNSIFHEGINDLLFVDTSFFSFFNFPIKKGKQESLFRDRFSVVITENTAQKYFGSEDPIGKTLDINGPPSPGKYTVTGVIETPPLNTHLQFDFLIPMENYIEHGWGGAVKKQGGWNGFSVITYLQLEPSANTNLVAEKLNKLIAQHQRKGTINSDVVKRVVLQPVTDIYLKSNEYSYAGFMDSTGDIKNIRIYILIALFILLIAWINYINLSTARSLQRAKEVGIRKSIGAYKKQLITQFISESVLVNLLAAILAIGLYVLGIPVLNNIIGKEIDYGLLQNPTFWLFFLLIIILGAFLSGLYPAFVLSSFKPINMLRAKQINRKAGLSTVNLRKGLIAFQFFASIVFISATYLVYKQVSFLQGQKLNIDIEQILVLRSQQNNNQGDTPSASFQSFKNEIKNHHSISSITSSVYTPGQFGVTTFYRIGQSKSDAPYIRSIFAGLDFSETYGLKFLAGTPFKESMPLEDVLILNATAIKSLGFSSPEDALQKKIQAGNRQKTIVGVVEDFHWHSLKESFTPYILIYGSPDQHSHISIKTDMHNISESIDRIQSAFKTFFPDQPFEYFFADNAFNQQYKSEAQFKKIFFFAAILAVFIACIGLFALVSYSTISRIKEISVRKVLGARVSGLMILLSKEYFFLLLFASLFSFPVTYYWGNNWLNSYAIRIDIGMDNFLFPSIILLFFSLVTVSYKAYSAANSNPVKSLKME